MKKIFMYFCIMSLALVFLAIKFGKDSEQVINKPSDPKETSDDQEMRDLSTYISQFQQIGARLDGRPYTVLLANAR